MYLPTDPEPVFPTGELAVLTEFVVTKPRTTKRGWPRGDNDNYEKAAWDAVTKCGAVWSDDDQIILNLSHKRFANPGEKARTEMLIVQL